ncbi:hypothetical protein NP493_677g02100 [Ridgeia piscesae]|uniref:Uncharacterized protein n=1 Tax=Ridgeia piscesae TaxID=27915 RepID=A0AAD9NQX1_RIDPI|nr:hypothetical protein NP493_677g02100 [Ridgeia piscesae]
MEGLSTESVATQLQIDSLTESRPSVITARLPDDHS